MLTSAPRSGGLSTTSVAEATPGRSPGVSSTAFRAQSPNLRFASLMDMDFAVSCPLVRRWRLVSGFCSSTRTFVPCFLQTPPRGGRHCMITRPYLHQVGQRTFTSKLLSMPSTQPSRFADTAKSAQPFEKGKLSRSPVTCKGDNIIVLYDPFTPVAGKRRVHRLPGQVQVERAHDIQAVHIHEKPECCSDTRIDIEKFELAVAHIVAIPHVHDPLIADLLKEFLRPLLHYLISLANSETGPAAMDGVLANLASGEADQTFGDPIEVAVEHPNRIVTSGNVLLEHQIGILRILQAVVSLQQFAFVFDNF